MATVLLECFSNATVATGCQFCQQVTSGGFSGLAVTVGGSTRYIDSVATPLFRGQTAILRDLNGEAVQVNFNDTTFAGFNDFRDFITRCTSFLARPTGNTPPFVAGYIFNSNAAAASGNIDIGAQYWAGPNHQTAAYGTLMTRTE